MTVTAIDREEEPEPLCCGERHPGVADKPLVLACQLCPTSPTYWRLSEGERRAP